MLPSSPQIVTTGGLRVDYLITRDGYAKNGIMGGNALFSAVGASIWSDSVGLWSRIGDNFPRQWLTHMRESGIDTKGIVSVAGNQEHRTFYAYTPDGRRQDTNPETHYARINEPLPDGLDGYVDSTPAQGQLDETDPLSVQAQDWPEQYRNVKAVHLAPMPIRCHLDLPDFLRLRGVSFISLDPGERYMVPALIDSIRDIASKIDCFLPSIQEIRSLLGGQITVEQAALLFHDWGAPSVIIKGGSQGVFSSDIKRAQIVRYEPFHSTGHDSVIDVTGAGDAFCGGFLSGWMETHSSRMAINYGLVSSSIVIEGYGASYAHARRNEARERLAQILSKKKKDAF